MYLQIIAEKHVISRQFITDLLSSRITVEKTVSSVANILSNKIILCLSK